MKQFFGLLTAACLGFQTMAADYQPEFSTAGFFTVDAQVRDAQSLNIGWRFKKNAEKDANQVDFDDSSWEVVNVPHGLELLPVNASGGVNYQGEAWYRKHLTPSADLAGKRLFLHFEAIMGKSKIWVNGELVHEQFGGYLPSHIEVTGKLKPGQKNVIAVWCDNSNDPNYPPGKNQEQLDFVYFGGIYRDVYLISTTDVYITNPNAVDKVASGGVLIHFPKVTDAEAQINATVDLRNASAQTQQLTVVASLQTRDFKPVVETKTNVTVAAGADQLANFELMVQNPALWTPDSPNLHQLIFTVFDENGQKLDAFRTRVGIRTFEFRGADGFYLNGKLFDDKLIGGNRHQDYAYIGNALPNNTHWRDAMKMREASMRVVRNAHYPQDPAFMDACDELGLFVIVNTPGWQFWNGAPHFAQRVYQDIRNMIRRDRNHASLWLWEPILNETWYPADFAKKVHDIVKTEYPFAPNYTASDSHARGAEHFDLIFAHPFREGFWDKHYKDTPEMRKKLSNDLTKEKRNIFTREWGDCVDNWNAHNSPSRVAKAWGENPMLTQLTHYHNPDYLFSSLDTLYKSPRQHIGGALWHTFDHQRGYHPDPFWGGIMDSFRQPKTSYYLFKSLMNPQLNIPHVDSKPFVYVAHDLSPFSPKDVTILSNCDEVRVNIFGKDWGTHSTKPAGQGMPHEPVVLKDAYHFYDLKQKHRQRKIHEGIITVEGLIDGKVVAKTVKKPALRRTRLILKEDHCGVALQADGSDIVPVVAYMAGQEGNVKRLSEDYVKFTVEGAGILVDDGTIGANPVKLTDGEAVALIRATNEPGIIRVKVEMLKAGSQQPGPAVLELKSVKPALKQIYSEIPEIGQNAQNPENLDQLREMDDLREALQKVQHELNQLRLKEVERQQSEFEGAAGKSK